MTFTDLTVCHGKIQHAIKNGKASVNRPFSMAMLNNQRVIHYMTIICLQYFIEFIYYNIL